MKALRWFLFPVAVWLVCAMASARAEEARAPRSLEELRSQLAAYLDQPRFSSALWGVKVVAVASGKTVFEYHADRLMSPASNSKLYTGALALDRLGGDYRISTPILGLGHLSRSGTWQGNVIIAGRGDPSWNERRLGTNFWAAFEPFVAALNRAGVRRVDGDLIADGTYFRGQPFGGSWTIDDLAGGEAGVISALMLDDNVAQVRVEPGAKPGDPCRLTVVPPGTGLIFSNQAVTVASNAASHLEVFYPLAVNALAVVGECPAGGDASMLDVVVPRPADWFAAALKLALARQGIEVTGQTRGLAWPQAGAVAAETNVTKLGAVLSPPLREVVRNFMKPSQNLEVDTLLAHVGEQLRATNAPAHETSERAGLLALRSFLEEVGTAPGAVQFDEGSGLSRNNLTTADATVALLQYMERRPAAADFRASLPIAGVDGTLRRRLKNTAAAGNLIAKTGTLRWAHALSGFVTTAAGERLAFSFMLNRFAAAPGRSGHDEIDPLALMLANFSGSTDDFAALASQYAPLGTLLVTQFVTAPFPHPARAAGHQYHGELYPAAEHYSNRTVALFIPKSFHAPERIDFVIHFHGWRNTVAGTLDQFDLVRQFAASGKNAILIVPEGPYNAPDSFGGKLEDTNGFQVFMEEALDQLKSSGALTRKDSVLGNLILSGHSGGYHVMGAILDHGGLAENIKETWLFDALYGETESFVAWQKHNNGRLLDIYTDHGGTREETETLMARYKAADVPLFASEDAGATAEDLLLNRLVFLHTDMVHNDVVAKRDTFEQFLKTSCLRNE